MFELPRNEALHTCRHLKPVVIVHPLAGSPLLSLAAGQECLAAIEGGAVGGSTENKEHCINLLAFLAVAWPPWLPGE